MTRRCSANRRPAQWTEPLPTTDEDGGNQGSPVTFNLPSGAYPFMILCADANGQSMIDNCKISNGILNSDGQIVVMPQYMQT